MIPARRGPSAGSSSRILFTAVGAVGCSCITSTPPHTPGELPLPASPELTRCTDILRVEAASQTAGAPRDGCLRIVLENTMSADFTPIRVYVELDGEPVMAEDPRAIAPREPWIVQVAAGRVPAGEHRVGVVMTLQGGRAGAVSIQGWRFQLRSAHNFVVPPGRDRTVRIAAYERPTVPLEERPAIRYFETPPPAQASRVAD